MKSRKYLVWDVVAYGSPLWLLETCFRDPLASIYLTSIKFDSSINPLSSLSSHFSLLGWSERTKNRNEERYRRGKRILLLIPIKLHWNSIYPVARCAVPLLYTPFTLLCSLLAKQDKQKRGGEEKEKKNKKWKKRKRKKEAKENWTTTIVYLHASSPSHLYRIVRKYKQ